MPGTKPRTQRVGHVPRGLRLGWLALALLILAPVPLGAITVPPSCPVSVEVYPFPELSLDFFEVQLTDGGPGDSDNAIDGACTFRTRVCLGSSDAIPYACPATRLKSFALQTIWRNDQAVADATVENVVEGVSRLFGGPEEPGKSITFPTPKLAQNKCAELPIRVPANTIVSAGRKLRFKFTVSAVDANGRTEEFTNRFRLKCHPRPPFGRTRTWCRTYQRDCVTGELPLPPGTSPHHEPLK